MSRIETTQPSRLITPGTTCQDSEKDEMATGGERPSIVRRRQHIALPSMMNSTRGCFGTWKRAFYTALFSGAPPDPLYFELKSGPQSSTSDRATERGQATNPDRESPRNWPSPSPCTRENRTSRLRASIRMRTSDQVGHLFRRMAAYSGASRPPLPVVAGYRPIGRPQFPAGLGANNGAG
jgi:hypothetical protein